MENEVYEKDYGRCERIEGRRANPEKVGLIFLTSLKQYALEGYKYQAVNYIVKPIKYIRLKVELNRWRERYQKKNPYIVVRNDTMTGE